MFHTEPWTGAEIYRLLAEVMQNEGGYTVKDNSDICTSVSRSHKPLYQDTINASLSEDNMCVVEEQQRSFFCTVLIGFVDKEYKFWTK
jgi:hypothetical protein